MDWIDQKYINLLSGRLERFKRQRNNVYNFRCIICGDSKRDKTKTRGFILEKPKVGTIFYCHNCHASLSFGNFLKHVDSALHSEYSREKFVERNTVPDEPQKPDISKFARPKFMSDEMFKGQKKISQLDPEHPAKKYVVKRRIPSRFHHKLFYIPKFKNWVNTIVPQKFDVEDGVDEPRLIIPFLDKDGSCYGFQGRSFRKDGIRYITIMLDDNKPKVYGLDSLDSRGTVFVVEGPIDSMFLPNSVAMAGSSAGLEQVFPNKNRHEIVIVHDNEPRNEEIIKLIDKRIDEGYNVVIWPSDLKVKDINDMVLAGLDPEQLVRENVKNGLQAKMALNMWKKI